MGRQIRKHRYVVIYETKGDDGTPVVKKIDFVTDGQIRTGHQMETMEVLISAKRESGRPVVIVGMELAYREGGTGSTQSQKRDEDPTET